MTRRRLAMVAAVSLLVGGCLVAAFFFSVRFDSAAWKEVAGKELENPVRAHMARDLLWRQGLVGKSRAWVDELLGEPTRADRNRRGFEYLYRLGPEGGLFGMDYEYLAIKFERDKVVEARIVYF